MRPVVQLERTGCGIASMAVLAGVSYVQAKHVANRLGIFADDSRLWSETEHVRRLLKQYGFRSAQTEVPFTSWEALPDLALLAIKWHEDEGRAFWHWVVFGAALADLWYSIRSAHFGATYEPTLVA
jgi:ABC-type bacteriocin/lantibiotic exporter with double-glycine peptidase domain